MTMISRTHLLPFGRFRLKITGTQSTNLRISHPKSFSAASPSHFRQTIGPCFSEKSHTSVGKELDTPNPNHDPSRIEDAFSNLSALAEARKRWGLDSNSFVPIVFPAGRPEIMNMTRKLKEDRIKSGKLATRTTRNDLRDQNAKEVLGLRTSVESQWVNPHFHLTPKDPDNIEPIPQWKKHKITIKAKLLGKAWNPQRKLSRQAMDEVRYLRKQFPDEWTTPKLAEHFNVASESIVRILSSNFQPSAERSQEQDLTRHSARKANVERRLEQIKAEKGKTYTMGTKDHFKKRETGFSKRRETEPSKWRETEPSKKTEVERPSDETIAARHAAWLKQKAERDQLRQTSRIAPAKLGAPKRFIGST